MKTRLSKETIQSKLGWELSVDPAAQLYWESVGADWYSEYTSPCGRFILSTIEESNMPCRDCCYGWCLHMDNSDMETIGWTDVEYVEQVQQLVEMFKDY